MTQDSTCPIVIVEDNPMDLDLTLRAFKKRRLANPIEVARDGEEALALVAGWPAERPLPVVILLDLNMPRVGGLEVLLRQVRARPQWQPIPIVILTTSAESKDVETAYKMGANSYIVKPVDFDKFLEVVGHIELYWAVLNTQPR